MHQQSYSWAAVPPAAAAAHAAGRGGNGSYCASTPASAAVQQCAQQSCSTPVTGHLTRCYPCPSASSACMFLTCRFLQVRNSHGHDKSLRNSPGGCTTACAGGLRCQGSCLRLEAWKSDWLSSTLPPGCTASYCTSTSETAQRFIAGHQPARTQRGISRRNTKHQLRTILMTQSTTHVSAWQRIPWPRGPEASGKHATSVLTQITI